jgi:hypothetical protein
MARRGRTLKASDPEEPDLSHRPCLPMVVKICVLGGLYVLIASLMLAYSVPAARVALANLLSEDLPNETEPPADRFFRLLSDDFNYREPHWYWPDFQDAKRSLTVRNGCVFMNLTDQVTNEGLTRVYLHDSGDGRGNRWLYVCVEIGLRCSDDNKLNGDVGLGMMCWGLMDNAPDFPANAMLFRYESPGSKEPGVYILSHGPGEERYASVVSVDIREWHNYTILWRPGNGTFLIDDEAVGSTDRVPSAPMAIAFHAENGCYTTEKMPGPGLSVPAADGSWLSYLDLEENQFMQIDHVRAYMIMEDYEEYSGLVGELAPNVSSAIEAAAAAGLNTSRMEADFARFARDWENTGYVHAETFTLMPTIMDSTQHLDEISSRFREASAIIDAAKEAGSRDVAMFEALYRKAGQFWLDYEYEQVANPLKMIIERKQRGASP